MLLGLMRKHAQSWLIKFMIAMIVVVFVLYFGYSFNSDEGIKVAEVNGESISRAEYELAKNNMLERYREEYKSIWSDDIARMLDVKNRALEALVEQKIVSQEAKKLGLSVTENEIRNEILKEDYFFSDGIFDENRYRALLTGAHTTPEAFEKSIAKSLLQQKLIQFLTTFLVPGEQEILDYYKYANEKVKLGFVKFSPDDFKDTVEKDRDAVNTYFEENKEAYRAPEKIKIAYLRISPSSYADDIKPTEDQLKKYYEDNKDLFLQENQVKASHILFKVAPDASPEDEKKIEEKAKSILEKAKKGEDFAELAKKYSEDTSSVNGGDVGYFSRKSGYVKPFVDAAFNLKKGEISDLVKSEYGYHIIKVDDIKDEQVKSFYEVKSQIMSTMKSEGAIEKAADKAQDLIAQMPYDVDLKEYASLSEALYNTTGFFSKDKPASVVRGDRKLLDSLFSLDKNDVTDLVELNNDYFIIQVVDKNDSYLPTLDEVYPSVESDYVDSIALKKAKAEADNYLKALKEGAKWEDLAKEKARVIDSTDFFTRNGSPGKIGSVPGIQEAAFKLNADNLYPEKTFENSSAAFVIKWEEYQDMDKAKYEEDKEKYTESLLLRKQQETWVDWIEKMKAKADIEMDKSRL